MSLVTLTTATAITTVPVLVTAIASLFDKPTTTTTNVFTTIIGLPGQTITILPTPMTDGEPQYNPLPAGSTPPPLYTVTVTEVNAFVQAPGGPIWTRILYDETGDATAPTQTTWIEPYVPGEKVLVLPEMNNGWNSWSTAERAGMCAGVVLFVLALGLLWWCCLDRRQEWIVQPRGTYWNGGYWGAGLRGGGGKWNIDRIVRKRRNMAAAKELEADRVRDSEQDPANYMA